MFTFKDIGGFMPKKKIVEVKVQNENTESKIDSHTEEKSLRDEVEEMKLALTKLNEMIELLKDIRYEVRDKNGFVKSRRDYND